MANKVKNNKINILFVCRYNRFRSRIAEAYFKKINKNKNIKAKSAGLFKGNPLNPRTVKVAKKFGLNIKGKVRGLSSKLMVWQNVTVIVADNVPKSVFNRNVKYGKKVIKFSIRDVSYENEKEIKKTIDKIIKKIDKLVKDLEEK